MVQVNLVEVSKVYPGNVEAVSKLNLAINKKEFVVLVGPSGCGKSTILRMIAGLEQVTEGEIYINNKLVNDVSPKDRDIAMVFQNFALYPHMTVYENMAFGLKLRRYPKPEIKSRVKETAETLGIAHLLKRRPKELSGGQRQRVALGRAIVRKPVLFLFDEPLSNLDAKMRVQMRAEIRRIHQRLQATILYVTHDQTEALTMGNRIVVLKDGSIQQTADPMSLYDKPKNKFVGSFIGTPPMNFLEGVIVSSEDKVYFQNGPLRVRIVDTMIPKIDRYKNKEIIFGLRAEDIYDKIFVSEASPENTVHAHCEAVELMGAEAYLYLRSANNAFIARVSAHAHAEANREMDLVFDMTKAHFFDKETEQSIF